MPRFLFLAAQIAYVGPLSSVDLPVLSSLKNNGTLETGFMNSSFSGSYSFPKQSSSIFM